MSSNLIFSDIQNHWAAECIRLYALGTSAAATQQRLVVNYPNVKRLNPNQSAAKIGL